MMKSLRQLKKILRALPHRSLRRGLSFKVGAAFEHEGILAKLPLATIVDVGANKGQFSLLARQLFPAARIFAFEPLARPAAIYRKVFATDALVTLFQSAIGSVSETREMHVSAHDDSSSLLPITQTQVEFAPGTGEVGREAVKVAPLGELLAPSDIVAPALLKIDVQGFELIVLDGSVDLLSAFSYVYVELSFVAFYEGQAMAHDVVNWLSSHGFNLAGIHNPVYGPAGLVVQADFFFARAA